ncbi:HesA/MoeB/ThiF family protein [Shimia sp.]|uniref:HesA/MoeB/ThiF family protein n=1 Tax=Shimia sp. TaxID=1954381 RepID=UPI003B8E181B
MVLVLAMAAGLWGVGWATGAPKSARWTMTGLLYLAVIGVQVAFPPEHPLAVATGGSLAMWLILGAVVAIVLSYSSILQRLRTKADANLAAQEQEETAQELFSETELNRYARHIVLRELGGLGQKKLKDAKVLVVGAGGLGSPVLLYLAAAGVGRIGVVDDDVVDNSNLQRQVIHTDAAIGTPKVLSAAEAMTAQNPFVEVVPYPRRLTVDDAEEIIGEYDLVLDGTDNFDTRYMVNEVCVAQGKPLISGALSQWEGQLSVFDVANGTPCYQCIFPEAPAPELAPSCSEAGVVGPLPGVVGTMMAAEAIKVITGAGAALRGEMMIYDALWGETRKIGLKPRADCPTCGGKKR